MLFKEKLLLSNCDSVKRLSPDELKKRFLTGMAFGDGVILSPNILIDNLDSQSLLSRRNVVKYLNEEGYGKLVLRGFMLDRDMSMLDYYERLPESYIFSSIEGNPAKGELSGWQEQALIARIRSTQEALDRLGYRIEPVESSPDSLALEIGRRLEDHSCIGHFFADDDERLQFINRAGREEIRSRSEWYRFSDRYFMDLQGMKSGQFKTEVIDPAYNSLFAKKGEGFLQDNIRCISSVPGLILDAGITYKALKNEVELFEYSLKIFEFISTLGSTELLKMLTDEALGYFEGKLSDKGMSYFSRKNWFGMYPKLRNVIGLEIK